MLYILAFPVSTTITTSMYCIYNTNIIILTTEQDHTHFNSPEHSFKFWESIHKQHTKILLVLYLFNYPIKFINVF